MSSSSKKYVERSELARIAAAGDHREPVVLEPILEGSPHVGVKDIIVALLQMEVIDPQEVSEGEHVSERRDRHLVVITTMPLLTGLSHEIQRRHLDRCVLPAGEDRPIGGSQMRHHLPHCHLGHVGAPDATATVDVQVRAFAPSGPALDDELSVLRQTSTVSLPDVVRPDQGCRHYRPLSPRPSSASCAC